MTTTSGGQLYEVMTCDQTPLSCGGALNCRVCLGGRLMVVMMVMMVMVVMVIVVMTLVILMMLMMLMLICG